MAFDGNAQILQEVVWLHSGGSDTQLLGQQHARPQHSEESSDNNGLILIFICIQFLVAGLNPICDPTGLAVGERKAARL